MHEELPRAPERTREVYDEIASHFAKTRRYPWPEVEDFLAGVDGDGVALDVGCGNGRHAALLAERFDPVIALDISSGILREAQSRMDAEGWTASAVQGDAAALPIRDDAVAVALSIATIHHLPDREARVQSLREIGRVLSGEGRALVSAWSTSHDRFDADANANVGFDTTIDWTLPGGETVSRFYHVYAPAEFDQDLASAGLAVADSYVSSGNCYAEVRP